MTRNTLIAGSAATAAGLACALYSWKLEPFWLDITRHTILVPGLSFELEGARVVQLSDIHVGHRVPDAYAREAFRRTAALEPDILVLTGDFVTYDDHMPPQLDRIYAEIPHGRLGTYAVLGNHDYGPPPEWSDNAVAERVADALRAGGVTVLRNEVAEVRGLQIVGMDDLWSGRFDVRAALAQADPSAPMLALSHNPDSADGPGWEPFAGWILAGHTHGGQVKLPFLPTPFAPVKNKRYVAGRVGLLGDRTLYVNRGVGFLHQVRFNVRPEIALFQLRGA